MGDDSIELKSIDPDKLLSELFDGSVVLDLLLKYFSDLSLTIVFEQLVSRHKAAANAGTLHPRQVICASVGQVQSESKHLLCFTGNGRGTGRCCLPAKSDAGILARWWRFCVPPES